MGNELTEQDDNNEIVDLNFKNEIVEAREKIKKELVGAFNNAKNFTPAVYNEIQKIIRNKNPQIKYVAEFVKGTVDGDKLMKTKDGVLKAIMTDENGVAKEIANIKIEKIYENVDLTNIAVQMAVAELKEMMQQQLEAINKVGEEVKSVHKELLINRDGLYQSAVRAYFKYMSAENENTKEEYLKIVRKNVNDVIPQLQAEGKNILENLNSKYNDGKTTEWKAETKEDLDKITSDVARLKVVLMEIHKSIMLECLLHKVDNEENLIVNDLLEYQNFVKINFTDKEMKMLYDGDISAKTLYGKWKELTLDGAKEITNKIQGCCNKEVLQIEFNGEE